MPYIEIGKIINTHGLRGDLKVAPWCDGIEVYEYLQRVMIDGAAYEIESVKAHKGHFLLKLQGIDTIEAAERYKNKVLTADEADMPPLPEGVYYLRDIMGLAVYEGEKHIGTIYDWIETGSSNVYVIRRPRGKDVLIPAIDQFIKGIDMEARRMQVELLEGMMDED